METRSDRRPPSESALERLGDVVGVHMVQHAKTESRQGNRFTDRQSPPHVGVEVARRSDHGPAGPADVTGMQDHAGYATGKRFTMQQRLDRRLVAAVLTEAGARFVLRHGHASSPSVHPDGAAVQQQRTRRPERVDEVLGGCRGEADQVDDGVRSKVGDPPTEVPAASSASRSAFTRCTDRHSTAS